jgi:chromosome segregation ATPase
MRLFSKLYFIFRNKLSAAKEELEAKNRELEEKTSQLKEAADEILSLRYDK